MPDWSYQTLFRPVLQRIDFVTARRLALRSIGLLGSNPVGRTVVQTMGHMRPSPILQTQLGDITVAGPVILSLRFDPELVGLRGLSEFGFGLLEVGPIGLASSAQPSTGYSPDQADWKRQTLRITESTFTPTQIAAAYEPTTGQPPLLMCLSVITSSVDAIREQIAKISQAFSRAPNAYVLEFADDLQREEFLNAFECDWNSFFDASPELRLLLIRCDTSDCVPVATILNAHSANSVSSRLGLCIDTVVRPQGRNVIQSGGSPIEHLCESLRSIRVQRNSKSLPIVVRSAVTNPLDALQLLSSGTDAVTVDSGIIFSGPGIVKRINNAILHERIRLKECQHSAAIGIQPLSVHEPTVAAWQWAALIGLAMFLGGVLTLWIGARGVLLPYDEQYLGMTSDQLRVEVPQLVSFMAHDRITLSGTMLALGIIYLSLAWFAVRDGIHWAMKSVWWSSLAGFTSFFTFLFFGYFDVLHAFISAVLLQFVIQLGQTALTPLKSRRDTCLIDDWDWKAAQWGQLLLVVQAAAMMIAGVAICYVASTHVFVQEDLDFLRMTSSDLLAIQPNLVGVVAHDRAAFGGMLLSCGTAILLATMWGFERGRAWLWWTLAISGTIAYLTTIIVHACVGYTSWWHLLPAFGGFAELWIALGCSIRYLCATSPANEAAWNQVRKWQSDPT